MITWLPDQAVVAGEDIRRQVRAGEIADMDFGVGVRPGDGDQDVLGHGASSSIQVSVLPD